MSYDVSLYGHLTLDTIYVDFDCQKRLGSMGNVWHALLSMNSKLKVHLSPTSVGEALIYVNKERAERISRCVPEMKTSEPKIEKSKWNHVLYLNELSDLSFLKNLKGTTSGDVCVGRSIDVDCLKYIDYLFIADEDVFMDLREMAKLTRGWIIMHSSRGSIVTNGEEYHKVGIDNLQADSINVLGAGDSFAAAFIANMLTGKDALTSVKDAHAFATAYLLLQ